jgi:hypothetical protein
LFPTCDKKEKIGNFESGRASFMTGHSFSWDKILSSILLETTNLLADLLMLCVDCVLLGTVMNTVDHWQLPCSSERC